MEALLSRDASQQEGKNFVPDPSMLSILALQQEQQHNDFVLRNEIIWRALSARQEANRVGETSLRSLDQSENMSLKEEGGDFSRVPCRARGMPPDHNFKASLEQ
jgi:hypothetical protein